MNNSLKELLKDLPKQELEQQSKNHRTVNQRNSDNTGQMLGTNSQQKTGGLFQNQEQRPRPQNTIPQTSFRNTREERTGMSVRL